MSVTEDTNNVYLKVKYTDVFNKTLGTLPGKVYLLANYDCLTLVKMVPGSWRDLAKIPARFPPGSRRDFGRRASRFPPGFLPGFLAGGGIPGGQNLGGIPAGILPGFLAGGGIPGGQNLGGIPAGILPRFLAGGGIPGGQNLGGIPAGILPGFLAGGGIPGGQNLGGIPAGVLPGFLAGNRISRWECCRDSQRETKPLAVKILLRSSRKNYVLYCSPKYCCYQPCTCFLIELSVMWYYFHVTITRRQRIVHVHVLLLQRAEFNVFG